ncbi:hypothetical protein PsorP6_015158 [Peronosclerospora sorghi]|uniref:Uncharacterized protein n=1 Tax=Peronosclerospora sorghi TaxID=230839 RepID=A0ACC0VS51_9STRA|nr:hypothetical protein PsorP6_015158 [Peronosclerospora sorghi]
MSNVLVWVSSFSLSMKTLNTMFEKLFDTFPRLIFASKTYKNRSENFNVKKHAVVRTILKNMYYFDDLLGKSSYFPFCISLRTVAFFVSFVSFVSSFVTHRASLDHTYSSYCKSTLTSAMQYE